MAKRKSKERNKFNNRSGKGQRIKRLKMENELLRSFLQIAGRR